MLGRTLIYATDINPHSLQKAQAGIYDLSRVAGFTDNHRRSGARSSLSDYYTAAYGGVMLDKSLRQHIVFSDHSLATDSVFAEVQLVSCRNVLIYFDRELQDRAVGLFRDSLLPSRLSRHRLEGIAALLQARGRLRGARARRSYLSQARRSMSPAPTPPPT